MLHFVPLLRSFAKENACGAFFCFNRYADSRPRFRGDSAERKKEAKVYFRPFLSGGAEALAGAILPHFCDHVAKISAESEFPHLRYKKYPTFWSSIFYWRRRGDSNSRSRSPQTNDLANRPLQPLGYPSVYFRITLVK